MDREVVRLEETHPEIDRWLKLYYHGTDEEVERELGIKKGTLKIYWNDPPGEYVVTGTRVSGNKKVGRNEPCPCQSGKKFKDCHGVNQ